MKRSNLKRTTPLRSTGPPRRRTRLKPMSKRRERENRQRRKNMLAAFGPNPLCAIRWDAECKGYAEAPHELRKRSDAGSITNPANAVPACHHCNGQIEDNPIEARERGFVLRPGDEGFEEMGRRDERHTNQKDQ